MCLTDFDGTPFNHSIPKLDSMNLSYDNISKRTKNLVSESKLDSHEGCTATLVWDSRATSYSSICRDWILILESDPKSSPVQIPTELLILVAGIKGNHFTSCLLHRNTDLELVVSQLLKSLMNELNVDSVRSLLLVRTRNHKLDDSTYASQILKSCMVHIARDSQTKNEDCLGYLPLFRDALVWIVMELNYPELAGEEFISVLQPLGLRLTEDYRPVIQISGLRVLQQLATKARIADWRQSCRAEAVLNQLTQFRLGTGPHCSEDLLDEVYLTILKLASLLGQDTSSKWYEKITERLLQDLLMESRRTKQLIILKHLGQLIDLLKSSFALHSRSFLRTLSVVLLGPRKPSFKSQPRPVESIEEQVYCSLLSCLYKYITFTWPILVPGLISDLLGPLVAFVDLYNWPSSDDRQELPTETRISEAQITKQLTDIFHSLIKLDSYLLSDVLRPICDTVPSLVKYLPN